MWRVANDEVQSLPAPEESIAPERMAEPSIPPQQVAEVPPIAEVPQPVFEVPEEILAGFYEQVVAVGLEDGKNQVFAELTVLQERFAGALTKLSAVSEELAARNQVQLMGLACLIAERLVRQEISVRPQVLLTLIKDVLVQQSLRDEVVVRCSPGDYGYLSENRQELLDAHQGAFTLRIEEDPEFEYGDFHIETTTGSVDGNVVRRVQEVKKAMTGGGADV